ncbi:T9SS type A sorting domain-containing protein [Natronogracilivirgula saccharolytica]|uniref:T9SS type A sorting domain-containing protein n=2 Tax=Natronogracilivirga saccharolytica TaxID=2812953 RepID=A0A8J7UVM0_9BACT|nr:T9SS type A sorting domain-containing protein [Natronogracilivirga saccharolytica]
MLYQSCHPKKDASSLFNNYKSITMKNVYKFTLLVSFSLFLTGAALGQDNVLQGADMENEDYWNVTLVGGSEADHPEYEFNYTDATPAHGDGGALRVASVTPHGSILFWQEVTLEGGKTYSFDGAFKDHGGLDNFWGEIAISDRVPEAGEDWGEGIAFSGFNTWDGCGPGVDGTFTEDGCVGDGIFTVEGEGEQNLIFGMKFGIWDGEMDFLVDNVLLVVTDDAVYHDVTFNVDMSGADGFNPDNHVVYVSGSMAGWAEPGSVEDYRMEIVEDGSDYHTLTIPILEGEIEYKYFWVAEGETGWSGEEWAGDPNRQLMVTGDTETNDVFGDQPPQDTGADQISERPVAVSLNQNYPNPFNPTTTISFDIPEESGIVSLKVYNALGQKVATLVNESLSSGSHTVTFDAGSLSSGIYIYQLHTGNGVVSRTMTLLK